LTKKLLLLSLAGTILLNLPSRVRIRKRSRKTLLLRSQLLPLSPRKSNFLLMITSSKRKRPLKLLPLKLELFSLESLIILI